MENQNDGRAAMNQNKSAEALNLKKRKPAYLAAAVIIIGLLVIYLLNVYHNKHENKTPLPAKTMTKPE